MQKKSKHTPRQSKSPPIQPGNSHLYKRWKTADILAFFTLFVSCIILTGIVTTAILGLGQAPPKGSSQPPSPLSDESDKSAEELVDAKPPTSPSPAAEYVRSTSSSHRIATSSQLLRFSSLDTRDSFLQKNNLSIDQLSYIAGLNIYATNFVPNSLGDGVEVYSNHAYSALLTPTDPLYIDQWYLPDIRSPEAWNHQTGTSPITVAVVDTGYALEHEDLLQKWAINQNENGNAISEGAIPNCSSRGLPMNKNCNNIDDDNDGYIDNSLGWSTIDDSYDAQAGRTSPSSSNASHGTLVAGMIGAQSNNAVGISGTNWHSKILPIKSLDDTGSGTTLSVAVGIRYAVDHGADVINLSLGSSESDPIMAEQIAYAIAQGVTIVAAAGNDGCDCIVYPARYDGVISVGATTTSRLRASFSSYGSQLTLSAPGTSICSTSWSSVQVSNRYTCGHNGTSFSSPLVAGAAANLLSQDSSLSPSQVRSALMNGAVKLSAMNGQARNDQYGNGLLDIYSALAQVSAPAPRGIILNTHDVSQAAASQSVRNDSLNTTCEARNQATCYVRAINQTTNEVVAIGSSAIGGEMNLYWSSYAKALSPGTWLIQLYNVAITSQSLVREDTLVISP